MTDILNLKYFQLSSVGFQSYLDIPKTIGTLLKDNINYTLLIQVSKRFKYRVYIYYIQNISMSWPLSIIHVLICINIIFDCISLCSAYHCFKNIIVYFCQDRALHCVNAEIEIKKATSTFCTGFFTYHIFYHFGYNSG